MIAEALVKREARTLGVDPMVIDRDYAIGVALACLARVDVPGRWLFKGGTCLRKAFFEGYRFSEDLDFTVQGPLDVELVTRVLERLSRLAVEIGVEMEPGGSSLRELDDEPGRRSLEARVPYRGPLATPNELKIQFHLSQDELVYFDPVLRPLMHPYPDSDDITAELVCYSLEEILTEKLRALCGQRRYAIARDLYDAWQLLDRGVSADAVLSALPDKASFKGLSLDGCAGRLGARRAEYEASWVQALTYLVPTIGDEAFDRAWEAVVRLVRRIG